MQSPTSGAYKATVWLTFRGSLPLAITLQRHIFSSSISCNPFHSNSYITKSYGYPKFNMQRTLHLQLDPYPLYAVIIAKGYTFLFPY